MSLPFLLFLNIKNKDRFGVRVQNKGLRPHNLHMYTSYIYIFFNYYVIFSINFIFYYFQDGPIPAGRVEWLADPCPANHISKWRRQTKWWQQWAACEQWKICKTTTILAWGIYNCQFLILKLVAIQYFSLLYIHLFLILALCFIQKRFVKFDFF